MFALKTKTCLIHQYINVESYLRFLFQLLTGKYIQDVARGPIPLAGQEFFCNIIFVGKIQNDKITIFL